jgi:hypothetical protein
MAKERTLCASLALHQFRIIELDLQQNGPTVKNAGLDVRQERRVCDVAAWRGEISVFGRQIQSESLRDKQSRTVHSHRFYQAIAMAT